MTAPYGLMADLHLHSWSAFSTTLPNGVNSRLQGLLDEIDRCASEVKAAGGERVFLAGDIFHVRGSVAPTVLNATRDALATAAGKYGTAFYIMPGNHDLEGKDSTRLSSAVTALENSYVKVLNDPTYLNFKDYRVVLVPWVESIDDLKETINKLGTGEMPKFFRKDTDLIIHAPVDGVISGLPAHGLTPEFLASLGFKRVFSGHYHNHKRMYNGASGAMTYASDVYSIGALAHHTWSDVGSKAGFLIVHPDRVDWRKSHLPEFIDLDKIVGLEEEEIPMIVDKNYVRVRVEASKVKDVEAARRELLDMGARAVIVQAEPKPPVREDGVIAPTVASGASLEVSVGDFVKTLKGIDEAAVTTAALAVLASVDSE